MSMHTRFSGLMASQEKPLPKYAQRELEAFREWQDEEQAINNGAGYE